jgi:stage V sporulation protein K
MSTLVSHKKNSYKKRFLFQDIPEIKTLKDLIDIGNTGKFYKNINNMMLWDITPYLEMLNNLIGMKSLKNSMLYQILYYLQGMQGLNEEGEFMHTIILGTPGTGKTSVAKIIGLIYKSMDLFAHTGLNCKFIQARRDNFIAEYLGQTAKKTHDFLVTCLGSVLFIDEAYCMGDGHKKDSFSKEALDTLNLFLSTHSRNFCCIIAGYEDDIKTCFLSVNSGLESRFPWVHKIDEYTPENLVDIFLQMLLSIEWKITVEKEDLIKFFNDNLDIFENKGRDILNFITKCKMVHSRRVFGQQISKKYVLSIDDLKNAATMVKTNKICQPDKISMYSTIYS